VRKLTVLLAALASLVATPAAQVATAPVGYTLTGTAGANGWFTSNVTIKWTIVDNGDLVSTSNCPLAEQIAAEGTSNRQCTAVFSWGTVTSPLVSVKIDKTAPSGVSGSLARAPDSNGWFNHPVAASFGAQDAVSGLAGCSGPTYAGADSPAASLTGTCTDVAGNSASAGVAFKYDATPPAITAAPDRKPDRRGWYRKPLTVTFAGTDLTSGIAACSAPARYAGPDLATAAVVGACRDAAGNVAELGHSFQYDATAPKLAKAKAELAQGVARVGWEKAPDVVQVELVRTPGVNGARRTTVYQGTGTTFVDRTVRQGVRYRYEIIVADVAGNLAQKAVTTQGRSALYSPAASAVVRRPPVLRWRAVPGARFYNVQLYRNGTKVLSTWPRQPSLQLKAAWRYAGRRQRLSPGTYQWYVWGARGTRAKPTYGPPLGTSTFTVGRPRG
jgi:hypothetical protein